MDNRPMRTCRLAFAVPVEPNQNAPQDNEGGVEWRDVSCYGTDDASLVVHRSADDTSVYSLSHASSGRSIPPEATGFAGSADRAGEPAVPDDGLGGAGPIHGGRQAVPPGQEANLRGA